MAIGEKKIHPRTKDAETKKKNRRWILWFVGILVVVLIVAEVLIITLLD